MNFKTCAYTNFNNPSITNQKVYHFNNASTTTYTLELEEVKYLKNSDVVGAKKKKYR